jgi:hypothetical protein
MISIFYFLFIYSILGLPTGIHFPAFDFHPIEINAFEKHAFSKVSSATANAESAEINAKSIQSVQDVKSADDKNNDENNDQVTEGIKTGNSDKETNGKKSFADLELIELIALSLGH